MSLIISTTPPPMPFPSLRSKLKPPFTISVTPLYIPPTEIGAAKAEAERNTKDTRDKKFMIFDYLSE